MNRPCCILCCSICCKIFSGRQYNLWKSRPLARVPGLAKAGLGRQPDHWRTNRIMSEFDSAGAVFKSQPKTLATLMSAGAEEGRLWRAEELGAIFRHQLAAPILVDLGGFDPATAARLKTLSAAQSLLLKSFSDLFHHPSPPVELLRLTKDFAKANMDHAESTLPTQVAAALYYASIAAALVRLDTRISQLKDAELRDGFLWARGEGWIDSETKQLLDQAARRLAAREGPAQ
jgi:hypothetical protein